MLASVVTKQNSHIDFLFMVLFSIFVFVPVNLNLLMKNVIFVTGLTSLLSGTVWETFPAQHRNR